MKKVLSGFLILFVLFIFVLKRDKGRQSAPSCPSAYKKMRRYSGKIDSAEKLSVVYAFPAREDETSPYDLITTELQTEGKPEKGHPRLHYIRYMGDGRFVEDNDFPLILTEHAREIIPILLHGKKALIVADHGFDWPPYAGGQPRILVKKNGHWKDETKKRFPAMKNVNFNVSAVDSDRNGNIDLLFSVVKNGKGSLVLFKNDGRDHFHISDQLSKELEKNPNDCYMTSRYWGREAGSDYYFLGGCDRPANVPTTPHDRILRVANKEMTLLPPNQVSPRFKDESWATADIRVADINRDGARDVVTAVHNPNFTIGGMQIYLKHTNDMSFQTPPDGYIAVTDEKTPSFVPFVRLADLDGDGFPEIVVPIVPIAVNNTVLPLKRYFAVYQNDQGKGFTDISMCFNSSLKDVFHADIVDLNHDGRSDVFLLSYDGSYEIFYR